MLKSGYKPMLRLLLKMEILNNVFTVYIYVKLTAS